MHTLDLHTAIAEQMDQDPTWADATPQARIDEHRRRLEAIRSGQMEAPPVPAGWADDGMERIKAESKRHRPDADRRSFVTDSKNNQHDKRRRQPQPDHKPTTTRPRFTRRPGADRQRRRGRKL